jgi:HK97 family phage portal protein
MGLMDRLFGWMDEPRAQAPAHYPVNAFTAYDFNDPAWANIISGAAGGRITTESAQRNSAVQRCLNLISNSIGMLPLHLMRAGTKGERSKASSHPLYQVLYLKPNEYQSSFVFRRLMQKRALTEGNAYAAVVRTGNRVVGLHPIEPRRVTVEQNDDWSVQYRVRQEGAQDRIIQPRDMLHIMGDTDDGLKGVALVDRARDVLNLSQRAEEAAARLFRNGVMAGSYLKTDKSLSAEAINNLKASMDENYAGAENAGRNMVLEEGLDFKSIASTAKDAQNIETRAFQIEEIARIFGVPRPFLMVDDTSWGSGIEQLGIFFVQYGLAPWFVAWEQAISLTLLSDQERRDHYPKFNERALMRGSMKDQAEFLAKMMGSGGSPQILEQNEARGFLDFPEHEDGFGLNSGLVNGGADNGA